MYGVCVLIFLSWSNVCATVDHTLHEAFVNLKDKEKKGL